MFIPHKPLQVLPTLMNVYLYNFLKIHKFSTVRNNLDGTLHHTLLLYYVRCFVVEHYMLPSRMESNSEENKIHCSAAAAALLYEQAPEMHLVSRGIISIKGKGEMETFWLASADNRKYHTV